MKTEITTINHINNECVEITALVYWRGLPRPHYEDNETDDQYFTRVLPIAQELDTYNNLHVGFAELKQDIDHIKIPKVADYDT
jgi:hypothetical protein